MSGRSILGAGTFAMLLLLACVSPPPALAACTSIGSCPFTISSSNCYNVTGTFSGSGTCITINSGVNNVTINLQGNTISGGTGIGISGAGSTGVAVIGPGIITGFGGAGITLGANAAVQEVTALSNGGAGISVGDSSLVTGCIAQSNGSGGISCGSGCSISGSVADSNTGSGISLGSNGSVINNSMYNNTSFGLNNSASDTGVGENVMYCNDGTCSGTSCSTVVGCAFNQGTSMGNNACNGLICF